MDKVSFHFEDSTQTKEENTQVEIFKQTPEKIAENVFSFNSKISRIKRKEPTICFATMCKDEEHCIRETLESVYKYIHYWVVCDTGSTDNTCKIVEDFFKEKGIPGELHIDKWEGFDINKTKLFNYCHKKTDYILHLDADDLLVGDFKFTSNESGRLSYLCWCKRGENSPTRYKVQFMFNNDYHWKFCGVAHTTIKCLDCDQHLFDGDLTEQNFFLNSRDTGNRSNDPEKYYKDALNLKQQFFNTLLDDPDNLNARSVFYTAQSYKDSGRLIESAQWYTLYTRLSNTWFEETFESYLNLGRLSQRLRYSQDFIIDSYKKAIEIISDRAEPYLELGRYFNVIRDFESAYDTLLQGKQISLNIAKKKYKLFVNEKSYGKFFDDELSVSCYWLEKYDEGKNILMGIIDDPDFEYDKDRLLANMEHFNKAMTLQKKKEDSTPKINFTIEESSNKTEDNIINID
jgi:glycosyltransferase involved in cell wall biosynthesis